MIDSDAADARDHWTESDAIVPTDIKLKRAEQHLILQWPDGRRDTFAAALLRKNCPCAACRGERQKQTDDPLHIMTAPAVGDITLTGIELVGHYAIRILWSDGHDTGIYDYRYLRSLG